MIRYYTHVGHVVRDIDKAIRLYRDVLGLKARSSGVGQIPGGKAFMIGAGDQTIELIEPPILITAWEGFSRLMGRAGFTSHSAWMTSRMK